MTKKPLQTCATIIYPHQLFKSSPALKPGRVVYLVEETLLLTHNPSHRQKLMLQKLAMDAYERFLKCQGYEVHRVGIATGGTQAVFANLEHQGITDIHVVDTTDCYLEAAINDSGLKRVWYESPMFVLSKGEAAQRYQNSGRHMARFYKSIRQDKNILLDDDKPQGGKWSFDEDNRKKLPKGIVLPLDISCYGNTETKQAEVWVNKLQGEIYGECNVWLPYTHAGAEAYLEDFLRERFANFGPYEDALTTRGVRLFHSTLSPLLNIGLITPQQVLDAAISYASENDIPINSLEGFVRQIIGWREFIRASYESDGGLMRNQNFFNHERQIPPSFWNGTTGMQPVDQVIQTVLSYGYTHHIERLMVIGNFMLLCGFYPNEIYRWFMSMYIDAYDWVMVPNVYGMSQFADGGSFATKPYISGSNYLKKMSDYPKGEWEETWTALYWRFIAKHKSVFENNHRLSMMPRMLEKMDNNTRTNHLQIAEQFLRSI